jgi:hypothetical protein
MAHNSPLYHDAEFAVFIKVCTTRTCLKSVRIADRRVDYRFLSRFALPLQQLTFGHNFNQNINNVKFPSSLQEITFGFHFNQNIDNIMFPGMLQQLTLGHEFNQKINHVQFPSSLQHITL